MLDKKFLYFGIVGILVVFGIFFMFFLNSDDNLDTFVVSCKGPAGSEITVFETKEASKEISDKINCGEIVKILERTCADDFADYTTEIDKVEQGNVIGWAFRRDLRCNSVDCASASDSMCGERY